MDEKPRLATFAELRGRKRICPQCGRQSFVPYVWPDDGNFVCESMCGRCDHEQGCTYHLPPRELFKDHPELNRAKRLTPEEYKQAMAKRRKELEHEQELIRERRIKEMFEGIPGTKEDLPHLDIIEPSFVERSEARACDTPLFRYLCTRFNEDKVKEVFKLYHLGRSKDGDTIYWQIDRVGRVRSGKIVPYQENGHRVKDDGKGARWAHSRMKKKGLLPEGWTLTQCLFGEHLLAHQPDKQVVVVEAEKTAIIGALAYPNRTWLAVGGKQMFKESLLLPLLSHTETIAYPDIGCYQDWSDKAAEMRTVKVNVSDSLEALAKDDPSRLGLDIGDLIMNEIQ